MVAGYSQSWNLGWAVWGGWSSNGGYGKRAIAVPKSELIEPFAFQIAGLPLIIIYQSVPHPRILTVGFNVAVPPISLVDGDDIDRISRGERRVAFNDYEIVVISVRGFESQIM